jgi:hypothetical protein
MMHGQKTINSLLCTEVISAYEHTQNVCDVQGSDRCAVFGSLSKCWHTGTIADSNTAVHKMTTNSIDYMTNKLEIPPQAVSPPYITDGTTGNRRLTSTRFRIDRRFTKYRRLFIKDLTILSETWGSLQRGQAWGDRRWRSIQGVHKVHVC